MSFDLAVWVVPAPVSTAEAQAEHERLCAAEPVPVEALHPAVAVFHRDLTARYPEFAADSTDPRAAATPWASGLCLLGTALLMAISRSRATEVAPVVEALAGEHGLTVFDPQRREVHGPPTVPPRPVPVLTRCDGTAWTDPDPDRIELVLRKLSRADWNAVLEREPQHYLQVARAEVFDGRIGDYVVEHRAGSPQEHHRAVLSDLRVVVALFQRYARGDGSWRDAVAWERCEVPRASG